MPLTETLLLIFNLVFVSFPEELFVVLITLSLMNKYDAYLKPNARKILLLSVPVVIPAILSNVLRAFIATGKPIDLMPLFGVLLISFFLIIIYRIKSLKDIAKCFLFSTLAFVIIMLIQLLLLTLVIYSTNIPVETFSKLGFVNFLLAAPERVIEALIIVYMALTKSKNKISMLKVILNKPSYIIYAAIILLINIGIIYVFSFAILKYKMLFGLNFIYQLLIITSIIIFPALNISAFISIIYSHTVRERSENKFVKQEIKLLRYSVNRLYATGDFKGIINEVDKFSEFWDDKEKYII